MAIHRHWKKCDISKLELGCEDGSLQMTMTFKLGYPDELNFPPPHDFLTKKKSPSIVRRQERRKNEASNNDKEVETENVSQTALQFKCDLWDYRNISEKRLKQHPRMKHKYFQILISEEKHNTSLNLSDVVVERDMDDQITSNLNSIHPCPLCKDDASYCCCGVCEECEYLITEEGLSSHIMNHLMLSQVLNKCGLRTECLLFSGIQTVQMIGVRVLSGTSSICDLSTLLYFLIFPICPVCVLPQMQTMWLNKDTL